MSNNSNRNGHNARYFLQPIFIESISVCMALLCIISVSIYTSLCAVYNRYYHFLVLPPVNFLIEQTYIQVIFYKIMVVCLLI